MNEQIKGWITQLQGIHENPPSHVAPDKILDFKRIVREAIDVAEEEADRLNDIPEFLHGFGLHDALARITAAFRKATACCVYERRGPRGPAEIAMALIDTPDNQPHNRERLYPVPQKPV